jgi:PAS domain S-box-containing protein
MTHWFKWQIQRLRKYYPPFGNWRFWLIQAMAVLIAVFHSAFEELGFFAGLERLYFVPISLLVVPVIYAAINFGFAGSIGTAIWVIVLTVPNIVLGHTGAERLGEIFQLGILVAMAVYIGQKVDRETRARSKSESANAALLASETKYRGLFDSSPVAILLLDADGIVIDANPAAGSLFDSSAATLRGKPIKPETFAFESNSAEPTSKLEWWDTGSIKYKKGNSQIYLEPKYTAVRDQQGKIINQILLRDVTEEHNRQAGLKAYTAYILRAQEDERQHIARELHDETIQTLALLCRQLDKADCQDGNLPVFTIDELREARRMAERVVNDLRNFTRSLRPPILDDLGMVASIRRLMLDFMERTGAKGQFKVVGEEKRLSRDAEIAMFRIAQEALSNIEHHALASNVAVTLAFDEQEFKINVSDDGKGFLVSPTLGGPSAKGRLGLVGMQERAELAGGKLEIRSEPGHGTSVSVSVPVVKSISEYQPDSRT